METGRPTEYHVGFRFIRSFYKLLLYLYPNLEYAIFLTIVLFIVSASNEVIAYHSGTVVGKFYKTLLEHNEGQFWTVFYQASLIYLGQTFVLALISLCSWLLAVSLRRNLVMGLHRLYFGRHVYYNVNREGLDNPITQDAEKMTTLLSTKILPYFIISPGVIGYYTYKTWQQAGGIGVGCIYGYFIIGSIVNRIIVSPITKWTARLERAEGDFRFKHVSVRNNAEESAFCEAHLFEHNESNRFLQMLLFVQSRLAIWKFPAQYFQGFFDYYGGVLTYAIQIIPIFLLNSYKDYTPGELAQQISNNAFFFMYLINSFTRLTDLAMSIGEIAGYTQRIAALIDLTNETKPSEWIVLESDKDEQIFKVDDLSFSSSEANKRSLISNFSIDITTLNTLLVTGNSGVGKTSIFRVLNQLWSPSSGKISRFIDSYQIIFLPQKPYLPIGKLSLKQQVLFPMEAECSLIDNSTIQAVLESLSLEKLLVYNSSIDDSADFEWSDILSPGEQQRLSIARVLLRRPKVVVLDESTSCVGEDMERHIYELFKKNQIHYISIGHRASLYSLHQLELHVGEDSYEISDIEHFEKSVHF